MRSIRRFSRLVVVLTWAVLVALVIAVPTRANMNFPSWTAGDFWIYATSDPPYSGTTRLDVGGTETVTVAGVSYLSHRVSVDSRVVNPGVWWMNLTGTAWYRTSDLALVQENLSGTVEDLVFTYTIVATVAFDPPQDIQWALTTGKTWATSGAMNVTQKFAGQPTSYGNATVAQQFIVESPRLLSVPAGTFDTTPLNGTAPDGSYNVTYWAPAVGNAALMISFDSWSGSVIRAELVDFRYQAASADMTPPTISSVTATPPTQVPGGTVVIYAAVTDNVDVTRVSVNVSLPDGTQVNRTMAPGSGNTYLYGSTWTQPGTHPFVVWALDVHGNAASAPGSFVIQAPDATPPTITNVAATPTTQSAGGTVTIAASVTDDVAVATVFVNVTLPDATYANHTMTPGPGNAFTFASAWSEVGTYAFDIWAIDTSGHAATAPGAFTILEPDTAPPTISHTPPSGPFYLGDGIRVVATVSDDVQVQEVRLLYMPVGGAEQNVTMTLDSGVYTLTIPGQTAEGTVRYRIYAVDPSGNVEISKEYAVIVRPRSSAPGIDFVWMAIILAIVAAAVVGVALVVRSRKRDRAPPSRVAPRAAPAVPSKFATRNCPSCEALVDETDSTCFLCGSRL